MKDNLVIIRVANDFSIFPAGRYLSDGDFSGESFLKNNLLPALEQAERVKVILDGTMGYGSSFLEEAFGGLVRLKNWKQEDISRIELVSEEEPQLINEIYSYMKDAVK